MATLLFAPQPLAYFTRAAPVATKFFEPKFFQPIAAN
jgi:hypothetical protein